MLRSTRIAGALAEEHHVPLKKVMEEALRKYASGKPHNALAASLMTN